MPSVSNARILVTGATGQLGRLVIQALLETTPATDVVALVRPHAVSQDIAASLKADGIQIRSADYEDQSLLGAAFTGVERLLLISSNAVGVRVAQHHNVIEAAQKSGVHLLAYTSMLHADTSPLGLAEDHRETEVLLRASDLPFVLLRNGWYTENYTSSLADALAEKTIFGAAGEGRIASAACRDFAAAAAAVLTTGDDLSGRTFELAGDESYSLAELASEVSKQSGQSIGYKNLTPAEYKTSLLEAGLPEAVAALLADCEAGAARGGLDDRGRELSRLIGRPTTPLAVSVREALAKT